MAGNREKKKEKSLERKGERKELCEHVSFSRNWKLHGVP
jgi:hypothetical protein